MKINQQAFLCWFLCSETEPNLNNCTLSLFFQHLLNVLLQIKRYKNVSQAWWYTPLVSALLRPRWADPLRPAWSTQKVSGQRQLYSIQEKKKRHKTVILNHKNLNFPLKSTCPFFVVFHKLLCTDKPGLINNTVLQQRQFTILITLGWPSPP